MSKDRSQPLKGPISDRIRSGEIAAGSMQREVDKPSDSAVKSGEGHSLGDGATTRGGNQGAS